MNKFKINTGVAAIALLSTLFVGWQSLLLTVVLMLLFCEINDKLKNIMTRIVTFFFGLTLFNLAWELIVDGIDLVPTLFNQLISLINNYLTDPISVYKLELYLFKPILEIVSIANNIIQYLLIFIKFSFILSVLTNKSVKENFIVKKINDFVKKAITFINSYEINQTVQQQNVQPVQQTVQSVQQNVQPVQQTVQPVQQSVQPVQSVQQPVGQPKTINQTNNISN